MQMIMFYFFHTKLTPNDLEPHMLGVRIIFTYNSLYVANPREMSPWLAVEQN